jgi:hypothetical protein
MARNENFYKQSILEADPSLLIDQFIPSKKFKSKEVDFSKERYLRRRTLNKTS